MSRFLNPIQIPSPIARKYSVNYSYRTTTRQVKPRRRCSEPPTRERMNLLEARVSKTSEEYFYRLFD